LSATVGNRWTGGSWGDSWKWRLCLTFEMLVGRLFHEVGPANECTPSDIAGFSLLGHPVCQSSSYRSPVVEHSEATSASTDAWTPRLCPVFVTYLSRVIKSRQRPSDRLLIGVTQRPTAEWRSDYETLRTLLLKLRWDGKDISGCLSVLCRSRVFYACSRLRIYAFATYSSRVLAPAPYPASVTFVPSQSFSGSVPGVSLPSADCEVTQLSFVAADERRRGHVTLISTKHLWPL